ncbi:thioesterase domain-containing protein (plasmid) [Candidatus Bandiella numerosa]|nr:thioesterase domain-containing protein [Candidatus Bandiella numerosa]WHA05746.1 thioesterase domain-containing protein [Candidatus Bandiella numerosa]
MWVHSFPTTSNGKFDRESLPEVDLTLIDEYIAPRNHIEIQLIKIWAEFLEIDSGKIGLKHDFFKLGGSSVTAIKLASKLNNIYNSNLKITDIYINRTPEAFISRIMQSRNKYQTIVKLNDTYSKQNLFMIHPGTGGCEVYVSLANRLSNEFSCYGVDSYNLYNETKIQSLNQLAEYYLSHIEKTMTNTKQEIYNLFGWSLGGQLALEIASILERRNIRAINVYLLDTALSDEFLFSKVSSINIEEEKKKFRDHMISEGHDVFYIEKAVSVLELEGKFGQQRATYSLQDTKVILFKAMCEDTRFTLNQDAKKTEQHILKLKYNNIDTVVRGASSLNVINVSDAHHGNILEKEEVICDVLLKKKDMS